MATPKLDHEAETRKRGEDNSKAFLAMEGQVHDLHRLANVTYDYALKLFEGLRRMRKVEIANEAQKHLSEDDEENIIFLFERIVIAAAKLPKFYEDPAAAEEEV